MLIHAEEPPFSYFESILPAMTRQKPPQVTGPPLTAGNLSHAPPGPSTLQLYLNDECGTTAMERCKTGNWTRLCADIDAIEQRIALCRTQGSTVHRHAGIHEVGLLSIVRHCYG